MPIMFRCTCGKMLQAREDSAGRKVKCGACGSVVVVPQEGPTGVSAGLPPSVPPFQAPPTPPPREDQGRFQADPPPPPPAAWDGGGSLGQREAPWDPDARRKREPYRERRGVPLWAKLLIVFLLVGAVVGGGWFLYSWLRGGGSTHQFAMVPRDGVAFGTIRVADAWNSKSLEPVRSNFGPMIEQALKERTGLTLGDIERMTMAFPDQDWENLGRGKEPEMWVIVHTRVPMAKDKVLAAIPGGRQEAKEGAKVYYTSPDNDPAFYFASDKEVWLSTRSVMPSLLNGSRKIGATGPLSASVELAAANKHHIVLGYQVPPKLKEMMLRGGMPPEAEILKDMVAATLSLNLDEGSQLEAKVKFTGEGPARQAADLARDVLDKGKAMLAEIKMKLGGKMPPEMAFLPLDFPTMEKILADTRIEQKGDEVLVTVPDAGRTLVVAVGMIVPAVQKVQDGAANLQTQNNLKQILLAMHSYHDQNKKLPPARLNKGLSWRVALLPYLDEAPLYNEFKLDESWDSPHNIKLLDRMPQVYEVVGGRAAPRNHTCFQVFTGDKLIFHPFLDLKSRIHTISDGSSNTFLVVESGRPVPWTKPEDIQYQPFMGLPGPLLGYSMPGSFLAGFGDGTVRSMSITLPPETLDRLIHPADGNVVDIP